MRLYDKRSISAASPESLRRSFGRRSPRRARPRALLHVPDGGGDVARSFAAISDRGSHSLLVYSGNDGGIDVIESHLGTAGGRMRRRKNFRFEIIDGADHTITPLRSQEEMEKLLAGYMCSVFA